MTVIPVPVIASFAASPTLYHHWSEHNALGTAKTDADGRFSLDLNSAPQIGYQLWADYPGSETLFPSAFGDLIGAAERVTITTSSPLTSGTLGTPYLQTLSGSSSRAPYIWVGSEMPPGLRLQNGGTVSGTPTASGDYAFSAETFDDSPPTQVAVKSFTISIH